MKLFTPLAATALLLGPMPSWSVVVETQSTPVPEAILVVKNTIESSTQTLLERLPEHADALEQAGQGLTGCNQHLAGPETQYDDHSYYIECRIGHLVDLRATQEDTAASMEGFGDSIFSTQKEIDAAISANRAKIDFYQETKLKHQVVQGALVTEIDAIIATLPESGDIPIETRSRIKRARFDVINLQARQRMMGGAQESLQTADIRLNGMKHDLKRWTSDSHDVAYQMKSNAGLVEDLIQVSGDISQAQIPLSQFNPEAIKKIGGLLSEMQQFNFNAICCSDIGLPEGDGIGQGTGLIPEDDASTTDMIKFLREFKQSATHQTPAPGAAS